MFVFNFNWTISKLEYYFIIGTCILHVFTHIINYSRVKLANVNDGQYVKKIYMNLLIQFMLAIYVSVYIANDTKIYI